LPMATKKNEVRQRPHPRQHQRRPPPRRPIQR